MKIIEINSSNFGSTGKIMIDLAEVAREKGYDCYTACPDGRSMRGKNLKNHFFIGSIFERNIHIQLRYFLGIQGVFSYFSTLNFIKKIKKIKPDIIHLHNLHDSYINIPLLFRYIRKNNIKTIWTLHDCWSFTGHCPHFTISNCKKWKSGCFKCPSYGKYPKTIFDNSKLMYTLKKKWFTSIENLTIVTPSVWLSDLVKSSFLKKYPIKVINNGIDLSVFKPVNSDFRTRYNIPKQKHILLGVAFGWEERKGLDVFIELEKRLDKNKYQIVLVGSSDVVDEELPKSIISIHKTQNQQELAEIYSAADVFVNPTREENYPTVNMESLACGTPVVTFATGGSPESLDEVCGRVVDVDDIDGLEQEIYCLSTLKSSLRDICFKHSRSFDKNDRFLEYIDIYGGLNESASKNTV